MIIFNGDKLAAQQEKDLKQEVQALLDQGIKPKIAAILFTEDVGSQLYTQLKNEAANRAGIEYEVHTFSMTEGTDEVEKKRAVYAGISLNFSRFFYQNDWKKTGKILEYWQPPYTVLKVSKDLD